MFTLNLLGGAAFQGRNGPVTGKAAHTRRVALLAILAAARGRTVGRERIIGLLWPEHRTAAARHLLSESLYVLRKELGENAFVSSGDEVGLNGEILQSDVEAFESEIEAGDVERAAALYRGPFLDGFAVADAPEFERWAEGERDRLARLHTRALECLASARDGEGRPAEAAGWWRRLVALDPYNSRVAMRLMLSLDASGERAAALWFAEKHVAFLRDELGVEPEEDFEELVERLRTEPVRVPTSDRAAPRMAAPDLPAAAAPPPEDETGAGAPVPLQAVDGMRTGDSAGDAVEERVTIDTVEELVGRATQPELHSTTLANGDTLPSVGVALPPAVGDRAAPWPDALPPPGTPLVVAPATGTRRGRRGWRRMAAQPVAAAALGVLLGAAASVLPPRGEPPPSAAAAQAPPGYDPRRVAVLYLDDYSKGGELGYLANGLTESLIHTLSQVQALEVISRNGVKPYRDHPVRFDSMVADLKAGSLVEGSVQRSGDSVRVTVQLVDANTRAHLESRTLVHAMTGIFELEDALADSVSGFLRRRLGREIQLRRTRAETHSDVAWRDVVEAEQARDDAARMLAGDDAPDEAAALGALRDADARLARAERADRAWARPTVLRGWIALQRGPLLHDPAAGADTALAFAERALARQPGNPLALELRGTVFFTQAVGGVDSTGQAARVDAAERDLRAAVAAEPGLASAWNKLSQVLRYRGRTAESAAMARRALQEDAYLAEANAILSRLYFAALYAADYREARALCDRGAERFPGDPRFVECRLTLMRADPSRPADPAAATRLLAELKRLDPPERARRAGRAYAPVFRLAVAAAVMARAGQTDSARAMLARARAAASGDAELRLSLAYDEAYVYLLLGQPETARALLEWSFTRRPSQRAFAARDPLFRRLPAGPEGPRAGGPAPRLPP
ncbi:MAG TPA: BTAD domain-containing putative transcriptional regulator [Longimicrobium sp.]|jgi:DNA-binding SARP family transcriptional activator/TolB-like protein/tetratricopeptide (TPR) repeat protein